MNRRVVVASNTAKAALRSTLAPRNPNTTLRPYRALHIKQERSALVSRSSLPQVQNHHSYSTTFRVTARPFCTRKMSDEEYTSFLEKANNTSALSTASTRESAQENSGFTANSVDTQVPQALSKVDAYYSSDTDEKFQPVSLAIGDDDLEGAIATGITDKVITNLTGYEEIDSVAPDTFDPRGQYSSVLDAVKNASGSDARIFRITLDGARCEYWVLGLDKQEKRIIGLRAPAVES